MNHRIFIGPHVPSSSRLFPTSLRYDHGRWLRCSHTHLSKIQCKKVPFEDQRPKKTKQKESRKEKAVFNPLLLLFLWAVSGVPTLLSVRPMTVLNFKSMLISAFECWPGLPDQCLFSKIWDVFVMKVEIAWGLVSSRDLGTLGWNPWYKSWAPSLLYNPTNFTIITLATLETPFSSFSKHHFYHQKRYARGGNKLKREPHPTKDRHYTHKLLQIEILLIKPGVESSSHDWIHSSPFHSIFPFTMP